MDVAELAELLHETEGQHGAYESTHPKHSWWDWYAAYLNSRLQECSTAEAVAAAGLYMEKLRNASR